MHMLLLPTSLELLSVMQNEEFFQDKRKIEEYLSFMMFTIDTSNPFHPKSVPKFNNLL